MSKRHLLMLLIVITIGLLLISPSTVGPSSTVTTVHRPSLRLPDSRLTANLELNSWWNNSFEYRVPVNITEPGVVNRDRWPVDVYLTFPENHAYNGSIRVLYWNGSHWIGPLIAQVWNETYYSGTNYLKSATVTFLVNVSKGDSEVYYIYYSKEDVGTISFEPMVTYEYLGSSQYEFNGTTYSVQTVYSQGGKIGYIWSLITGDEIGNKGDGGNTGGPAHWNPDGSNIGSTTTTPIEVVGIVEKGPIFIKYKTVAKFSASTTAKSVIEYTFYWWGWITETNSSDSSGDDWGTYRNNEWVFDPYIMPKAYIVKEDGSVVNYTTIPSGTNIGHARYFTYYNNDTGNGIGTSNVELTWYNFSTTSYYHRIYYTSSYEFWDRYFASVTNSPNCWIYERFAMIVWNASGNLVAFDSLAKANRHPVSIDVMEEDVLYRLKIRVVDGDNDPIQNAMVYVSNVSNIPEAYSESQATNATGECFFALYYNGTYKIYVNYTTSYIAGGENIVIHTQQNILLTQADRGIIVQKQITLPMATLTIYTKDLLDRSMGTDAYIELYNGSQQIDNGKGTTVNGYITFEDLPYENYIIYASYVPSSRGTEYWISKVTSVNLDFNSAQSITITMPLTDFYVYVKAYNNEYLSGVNVEIKSPYLVGQNHTLQTNASGIAYFYRVEVNQSAPYAYTLTVKKNDAYGQTATNYTTIFKVNSTSTSIDKIYMTIPLTYLNIEVRTNDAQNTTFEGVEVNVSLTTGDLVATGVTNSSGRVSFWIVSNYYNVSVLAPASGDKDSAIIYAYTNYSRVYLFRLLPTKYADTYTAILNNNSTQSFTIYYGSVINIEITFVDRDGNENDPNDNPISANEVFFEIYYQGSLVKNISYSDYPQYFENVSNPGVYLLKINTADFKLNATSTPYQIYVGAYKSGYDKPDKIVYYITVLTTSTSYTVTKTSITVTWLNNISLSLNYMDAIHGTAISDANITYEIYSDTFYYKSTISQAANTSYVLNINTTAISNDFSPGTYILKIYMSQNNYESQITSLQLIVNKADAVLTVLTQTPSEVWSKNVTFKVDFTTTNGFDILGAEIYVNNESCTDIVFTYNNTGHYYQVIINTTRFTSGTYTLEIIAKHKGFETKYGYIVLTVNPVPTSLEIVGDTYIEFQYGTVSNISISAIFNDTIHNRNITDGTVYYVIEESEVTGSLTFIAGYYKANISVSGMLSGVYHIRVVGSLENYTTVSQTIILNITPIVTYIEYIDSYVVPSNDTISLIFNYTTTGNVIIDNAIGHVNWTDNGVSLFRQQDRYVAVIDTSLLPPGNYTLKVTISAPGYEDKIVYIKFTVLKKIVYETEDSYEEYWSNTLPINITVYDMYNSMTPLEDATVSYQWFDESGTFDEIGDGVYTLNLNLTKYNVGTYYLNITVSKDGYYTTSFSVKIIIKAVPMNFTSIEILPEEVEEGSTVTFRVYLVNLLTNCGVADANVTIKIYKGGALITTLTLEDLGNGTYYANMSTTDMELGSYLVVISASKQNYESPEDITETLLVIEKGVYVPLVGRVPMSSLYFTIGISIIASISLASVVVAVRHLKIPKDIRLLDAAIKAISKGKMFDSEKFPRKDEIITETLQEHFAAYGLPIPKKKAEEE